MGATHIFPCFLAVYKFLAHTYKHSIPKNKGQNCTSGIILILIPNKIINHKALTSMTLMTSMTLVNPVIGVIKVN